MTATEDVFLKASLSFDVNRQNEIQVPSAELNRDLEAIKLCCKILFCL